jgi:spore germination protein KB
MPLMPLLFKSELVSTSILFDTPEYLIVIGMMITCIYSVSRGVEASLRSVEVLAPVALGIIVILLLFGINNFKYYLLLPILSDSSLIDVNLGALELSSFYSEMFYLTMLIPYLDDKDDINKIYIKSIVYPLGLLAIIVIICQISLGVDHMEHSNFPFLLYVRSIDLFELVERIDSIAVVAWIMTSLIRVSAFLLISVLAFREILEKDERDKIILPILGLILAIMTFWTISSRSVIIYRGDYNLIRVILFVGLTIVVPILTCIVYFFRRKSLEDTLSQ